MNANEEYLLDYSYLPSKVSYVTRTCSAKMDKGGMANEGKAIDSFLECFVCHVSGSVGS